MSQPPSELVFSLFVETGDTGDTGDTEHPSDDSERTQSHLESLLVESVGDQTSSLGALTSCNTSVTIVTVNSADL